MKPLLILIGAGIAALGLLPENKKGVDGAAKIVPNSPDGKNPQNEPAPIVELDSPSEQQPQQKAKANEGKSDSDNDSD